MTDFEKTTKQEDVLPAFHKLVELSEGKALKDDTEVIDFANKTVPAGKTAKVIVNITVISLE